MIVLVERFLACVGRRQAEPGNDGDRLVALDGLTRHCFFDPLLFFWRKRDVRLAPV
jgi:hypothetical protein